MMLRYRIGFSIWPNPRSPQVESAEAMRSVSCMVDMLLSLSVVATPELVKAAWLVSECFCLPGAGSALGESVGCGSGQAVAALLVRMAAVTPYPRPRHLVRLREPIELLP